MENTIFIYTLGISHPEDNRFSEHQKYIHILMDTILSPVPFSHQLKAEEWKRLFILMDILYGNALKIWLSVYDCLSEEEIALCYFCYIGVKHKNQAVFFGISSKSLSKRKQRLKDKLRIPQGISLEEAMCAISSPTQKK